MNLKKAKLIAIPLIFLISISSHFAYTIFPNIIFSFLFPVNESIWEHMKIIFTPILIYGMVDYYLLNKYKIKYNNFPFQLYFTALSGIPIYLVIYVPLYKLLGESPFISITLLLIIFALSQYISYQILKDKPIKILNAILVPIILVAYTFFIYLTYNPPHNYIFYDAKEEKYGLEEYKQIS